MQDSRECDIPPEVFSDPNRREVLRAWVANGSLHASIWIPDDWPDPANWGIALTDIMRHLADAYHKSSGIAHEEAIRRIRAAISAELESPTSDATGDFLQ
jgi:hypothetical protein